MGVSKNRAALTYVDESISVFYTVVRMKRLALVIYSLNTSFVLRLSWPGVATHNGS